MLRRRASADVVSAGRNSSSGWHGALADDEAA